MATINLQEPQTPDVYSFGFDRNLMRENSDNSTGVVYDTLQESLNTGSMLSGGNLNVKTLSIGNFTRQVAPGDDIQAAMEAVSREGGGIVQLLAELYLLSNWLIIPVNVILQGVGIDLTVLDFQNKAFGVQVEGNSTNGQTMNFQVKDLTIRKSNATAGLDILKAKDFSVSDVRVTLCLQNGIRLQRSERFNFDKVKSDNNTGDGFLITTGSPSVRNYRMSQCQANNNGGNGFNIAPSTTTIDSTVTYLACISLDNTVDGFAISGSAPGNPARFIGCDARRNSGSGFSTTVEKCCFIACDSASNTLYGFKVLAFWTRTIGCKATANGSSEFFYEPGDYPANVHVANLTEEGELPVVADTDVFSIANSPAGVSGERKVYQMTNGDSSILREGSVVVLLPTSSSAVNRVTTTTTNGDKRVFGISLGRSTGSPWNETVLATGFTSTLYVTNGAASISIGNYLSTYSHAYYAKFAASGDMAFAVALASPTTSTAQIPALLVSPRLV